MSLINRGYLQGGQDPVHDSFGLPRQWFMFSGHVTKELGYFVSIQNGFDTVSGLDMFLDLNYDRRLQFRMGRFEPPVHVRVLHRADPGPDHSRAVDVLQ